MTDQVTSFKDFSTEFSSTVYPNPTTGLITIISSNKVIAVKVFNITAELVIESTERQLDLSTLADGVYFIQEGGNTQKVIKH
jgi:hypothetical protein